MALTNMYSDLQSNLSSGLCFSLFIYLCESFASWGVINTAKWLCRYTGTVHSCNLVPGPKLKNTVVNEHLNVNFIFRADWLDFGIVVSIV